MLKKDTIQFGAYTIVKKLDAGSEGFVYLAQSSSGANVALKIFHPHIISSLASKEKLLK